jgi:asparagine synthase (glutamine-hydrolysing)
VSGVYAVVAPHAAERRAELARTMLRGLRARGADAHAHWTDERVVLGAAGFRWEAGPGSAAGVAARRGGIVAVADATLYYRDELRRALRGAGIDDLPADASAAELIAAAYAAWGDACAERLEGDFAFVVWDAARGRLLCARDATGTRPLYHARVGEALVVASTAAAALAFPGCPTTLNLPAVARAAAGFFAVQDETAYAAVAALPPGHRLISRGGGVRVERFWRAPTFTPPPGASFEEAAGELRELIGDAVEERLATTGETSVWLSGGYDSTAVFAAGNARLARSGSATRLRAVSVSYPPGDPGREDEWIALAASHSGVPVRWLDIARIPLLGGELRPAAERDDPFAHLFEGWNAALAGGSRDVGARVALTGVGGDHLFQVSAIFLADLARQGRWLHLWREWRARNPHGTLRDLLPWALARRDHLTRTLPEWIDRRFAHAHGLEECERQHSPPRGRLSHAAYESHWMLAYGYRARLMAALHEIGLARGIEIRSPLFDERLIRFAASRPVEERASGGETKRLLRRSMAGLLPAELLAPRRTRTGTTGAYLDRSLRGAHGDELTRQFRDPALGGLGVVEPHVLQRSCTEYLSGRAPHLGGALLATLHAELWVRARIDLGHSPSPGAAPDVAPVMLA